MFPVTESSTCSPHRSFASAAAALPESAWVFDMGEKELVKRAEQGRDGRILPAFNPHDISILAWAYAGSYRSNTVMHLLTLRVLERDRTSADGTGPVAGAELHTWSGRQLSTFAVSMARAGVRNAALWEALRRYMI